MLPGLGPLLDGDAAAGAAGRGGRADTAAGSTPRSGWPGWGWPRRPTPRRRPAASHGAATPAAGPLPARRPRHARRRSCTDRGRQPAGPAGPADADRGPAAALALGARRGAGRALGATGGVLVSRAGRPAAAGRPRRWPATWCRCPWSSTSPRSGKVTLTFTGGSAPARRPELRGHARRPARGPAAGAARSWRGGPSTPALSTAGRCSPWSAARAALAAHRSGRLLGPPTDVPCDPRTLDDPRPSDAARTSARVHGDLRPTSSR